MVIAAILTISLLAQPATSAAQEDPDERALAVSRRLMSPFCPGKTLASCTSRSASEWIEEIRGWIKEGLSEDEIEARLQARVPEFDLSGDPGGAWDWLLGLLAAVGTTGVLVVASRRLVKNRRSSGSTSSEPSDDDEWEDRLDDELRELDA